MSNIYIKTPTNRDSRERAATVCAFPSIKNAFRPERWLNIGLSYLQLENTHGNEDVESILKRLLERFPDLQKYLQAFFFEEKSVTANRIDFLIKSWFDQRVVFDPRNVEIPVYGELIDLELAKRLDIIICHTNHHVSYNTFVGNLQQVRHCICIGEFDIVTPFISNCR